MATQSQRWNYRVVKVKPGFLAGPTTESLQQALDQLGNDGWELVNAVQPHSMRPFTLFLKRPL